METHHISLFPNDHFLDIRPYQYGWEQCKPLHSFGPFVRNHYLFHYIISGKGMLYSLILPMVKYMNIIWEQTKDS